MFKNQIKIKALMLLGLGLLVASCTKEEADVEVENYGLVETYEIQKNLNAGVHGCVELVFPVSVTMPDSTILEFDSFEDAKSQLQEWKEANPDLRGKPRLIFPVEVITQDGETVSVENRLEIRMLIKECRGNFPPRPRHFRPCFKVEYPLTIAFPDGNTAEVENRVELKQTLRQWKIDNPDAEDRPKISYPITIAYEDGSTVEISSREALIEAKKACRE